MARELGVSRPLIVRRLRELDLPIRSSSEANRIMNSRLSPEERRRRASAAREATMARRQPPTFSRSVDGKSVSTARVREAGRSVVQPDEAEVAAWLDEAGVDYRPQVAIGPYNVDFLLFDSVAVEIHSAPHNPSVHPRLAQRSVELLDAGWSVGYLWFRPGSDNRLGGHDLVIWAEFLSRTIPDRGHYRVVRGNGENVTPSRADLHDRAAVAPPRRRQYLLPRPGDLGAGR